MNDTALRLLLIEDQPELAGNIIDFLEAGGHIVDYARDGREGLMRALSETYDVVLLDLQLPRLDGIEVCRQLRSKADRHVPVLMLTARDTLDDKSVGFEAGADDYLAKPFALEEVLMRCRALSRRHRLHQGHVVEVGPVRIDKRQGKAWRDEVPLALHHTPLQILITLAEAHPAVVTRSELSDRIWGDDPPDSGALSAHIYNLRQGLDKPFQAPLLKTVHGIGFRLDVRS